MPKQQPYGIIKIKGKTYWDYSIKIKGIVYDCSVCLETKVLNVRKDEWQGK